jgi:hypothetical protein
MGQKRDYTDDGIISFQSNVDDFFQIWVELHSHSGCTNYIHMLYSGHIAEYTCFVGAIDIISVSKAGSILTLFLSKKPAWRPCRVQ